MSMTLTSVQIERLKEISSSAAIESCQALSQWLKVPVEGSIRRIEIMDFQQLMERVNLPESTAAGIFLRIEKGLEGSLLLMMPETSALEMAKLLLRGRGSGSKEIGRLEKSALQETANILGCAYLNAFGKTLGKEVYPGPPQLLVDHAISIVESILVEIAVVQDSVLISELVFTSESHSVDLEFFFFPSFSSLGAALK